MSRLEDTIAHGNRGHVGFKNQSWIGCEDGYRLSVIAGGGTYCAPKPSLCMCWYDNSVGMDLSLRLPHEVAHDFPGPYTHVEVMTDGEVPATWNDYEAGGVYSTVPVDLVRELVQLHGGEIIGATCRGCGCTDEFGCEPSCSWVEPDLCTACVEVQQ